MLIRRRMWREIMTALDNDTSIEPAAKRRLKRKMRRPFVRMQMLDYAMSESLNHGAVVISGEGNVEAQVDWESVIELMLTQILPALLELLELFG